MNPRIMAGLLFEHVTRTWQFVLGGFTVAASIMLIALSSESGTLHQDVEPTGQAIALFIVAIGLLYSTADGDRLTCDIPQRITLLPVSTPTLVATRLAYGAAAIAASSLLVHGFLRVVADGWPEAWWLYPVVAVSMYLIIQTIAFAVGCFGDWSIGLLMGPYILLMSSVYEYETRVPDTWKFGMLPILFGVCVTVSAGVVHLRRTGRWDPEVFLPRRTQIRVADRGRELPPFESPSAAQRWFELRRLAPFALVYAAGALTLAPLSVLSNTYADRFSSDYTVAERWYWTVGQYGMTIPFVFIYSAGTAGAFLAFLNARMQRGPMIAFLFLRPMSTENIAYARVAAAVRGLGLFFIITVLLTTALCSFFLLIDGEDPSDAVTGRWSVGTLVMIFSLMFLATAAAAWAVYWSANLFAGLILYAIAVLLIISGTTSTSSAAAEGLFLFAWGCAGVAMAALLAFAYREGLLPGRRLVGWLATGIAASFALWFAGHWDRISRPDVARAGADASAGIVWQYDTLPIYAVFALFLALPAATIPLTMRWARHR